MMHHRHFDLADDRQVVRQQQVEIPMNAAANRVLDRQDPALDAPGGHGFEHVFEALAGHELSISGPLTRGGFAKRSWLPLIGDTHGHSSTRASHRPAPAATP